MTPAENFEHTKQMNRDRQKRFYEKKARLAEGLKIKTQNNTLLPTDTTHFQTIHHPIHITPEVAIDPAQITPPSTPYESRTLTITV